MTEAIYDDNKILTTVVTPEGDNSPSACDLVSNYLFGVDLTKDDGTPYPDSMFDTAIALGIARVETELNMKMSPIKIEQELHDYYINDYVDFAYIDVYEYPVRSIIGVKAAYPPSETIIDFPNEWVRLNKERGQIQLVPTEGTLSTIIIGRGGSFLPLVHRGLGYLPQLFRVDYQAGFEQGKLPADIKHLIMLHAGINILNTAGDLIQGAGIASRSESLDGFSRSISTTSSATNAGYGARILEWNKEIKEYTKRIKTYYRGLQMEAL